MVNAHPIGTYLGEIKRGRDIGYSNGTSLIWSACEVCGKTRWVAFVKRQPVNRRCMDCRANELKKRGSEHWHWKGGRVTTKPGYILVLLQPDDFFFPMTVKKGKGYKKLHPSKGYVFEHRLVMAKSLSRCLLSWEVVHHKNGIKNDNRIENLELINGKQYHLADTWIKSQIAMLQKRVTALEAENILLRQQLEIENVGRTI